MPTLRVVVLITSLAAYTSAATNCQLVQCPADKMEGSSSKGNITFKTQETYGRGHGGGRDGDMNLCDEPRISCYHAYPLNRSTCEVNASIPGESTREVSTGNPGYKVLGEKVIPVIRSEFHHHV